MREWIICKHCGLKFRAHEPVCPRCEKPADEGATRWSEERGRGVTVAPPSKTPLIAALVLVVIGVVGAVGYFLPEGFFSDLLSPSLPRKLQRACEEKAGRDCRCVAKKTADMMSPEQRGADFDSETPETRELMNTASQLCLKEALAARCQSAKQGNEIECACIASASINTFTADELEQLFTGAEPPARYASIRSGCYR